MELLLVRLGRKLGLTEPEEDEAALMEDELLDAEGEILLYLGCEELEEHLLSKVVELAAVFYRRDSAEHEGAAMSSYTEGQISESVTYLSPSEYRAAVGDLLDSLARYRRVTC